MQSSPLFAWRSGAREQFEVKDARSAPPPAAALRAVFEFEFLSRRIAFKQSMDSWRWGRRAPGVRPMRWIDLCERVTGAALGENRPVIIGPNDRDAPKVVVQGKLSATQKRTFGRPTKPNDACSPSDSCA